MILRPWLQGPPLFMGVTLGGGADFCVGDRLDAFPAPGWCDQPAPAVIWRMAAPSKHAVVTGLCRAPDYADLVAGRWKCFR
jgi:hypothetical protein